jgi:hypothetical protein
MVDGEQPGDIDMSKITVALAVLGFALALAPAAQAHEVRVGIGSSYVTIHVPQSSDAAEAFGRVEGRAGAIPNAFRNGNPHP